MLQAQTIGVDWGSYTFMYQISLPFTVEYWIRRQPPALKAGKEGCQSLLQDSTTGRESADGEEVLLKTEPYGFPMPMSIGRF